MNKGGFLVCNSRIQGNEMEMMMLILVLIADSNSDDDEDETINELRKVNRARDSSF